MSIDVDAAQRFVYANARLIERHQFAVLVHGAPAGRVLAALAAYRNDDGGFGHGLEPDVRCPDSQPAALLHALDVLLRVGAAEDPMVAPALEWLTTITEPDGGITTVLPSATGHPHAPYMEPTAGSGFLTYAIAAKLWEAGTTHPWLKRATEWCWAQVEDTGGADAFTVKFALDFLDAVPDAPRAARAIERLRPSLADDGTIPVTGGIEGEMLTLVDLSPRPGTRSRVLFSDAQVQAALDRLEADQQPDGGWDVNFLRWSAGQANDWRGIATLLALTTLRANGRLDAAP